MPTLYNEGHVTVTEKSATLYDIETLETVWSHMEPRGVFRDDFGIQIFKRANMYALKFGNTSELYSIFISAACL